MDTNKRTILVCNDDGIMAQGIRKLAAALAPLGDVWVIAPDREQSAVGHGISLRVPLRCETLGPQMISVSGTPADCVYMAVHELMPRAPDLVVSGINRGSNIGDDVLYSGTVAAAIESTLVGIPSIAVSLERDGDLDMAAHIALRVAKNLLKNPIPTRTLLNLNIPAKLRERWEIEVTKLGVRKYNRQVRKGKDPRGGAYYWIGGPEISYVATPGTDCGALDSGNPSITPLQLDLTDYRGMDLNYWPTVSHDNYKTRF